MWIYLLLVVLVALCAWRLSRTNLWRSKSTPGADGRGRRVGLGSMRAVDDINRSKHEHSSGLRKGPYD